MMNQRSPPGWVSATVTEVGRATGRRSACPPGSVPFGRRTVKRYGSDQSSSGQSTVRDRESELFLRRPTLTGQMTIIRGMNAPRGVPARPDTAPSGEDLVHLQRMRAGDQGALRALYDAHHAGLYRFLRAALGREDAEEILQDVFVTAWQRAGTFRGASTVSTWLYGVARNRRQQVKPTWELQEADTPHSAEQLDFLAALQAVRKLPVKEREVIELVSLGELSLQEAAQVLGVPLGTVKSRQHAARARLRAELGGTP
jgi:RNA polymerase sigma-70 factor, ECF subfamily